MPYLLFFICLFSTSVLAAPQLHTISGNTMGTSYHIKWLSDDIGPQLQTKIDLKLAQLNAQVSTYDPQSTIAQYNQSPTQTPIKIAPEFETIANTASELYQLTQGKLDVTMGPLVNLWGFGPDSITQLPTEPQIQQALQKMGLNSFTLSNGYIQKNVAGAKLDFAAIAKGYGVDMVAQLLTEQGIEHYMVEIGGEIKLQGHNQAQQPWRVAILQPTDNQQNIQKVIQAGDMAIATSGDYMNYYEYQQQRYNHLLDPSTGKPIQSSLASVTVLHQSCMVADGYATALTVMGLPQALAYANKHKLAAMFISRENEVFTVQYTAGFEQFLN